MVGSAQTDHEEKDAAIGNEVTKQAHRHGGDDVAGRVESLVASLAAIEQLVSHDPERNGTNGRTENARGAANQDLGRHHGPKGRHERNQQRPYRQGDDPRGNQRAFGSEAVHQRARRGLRQNSGDPADGERDSQRAARSTRSPRGKSRGMARLPSGRRPEKNSTSPDRGGFGGKVFWYPLLSRLRGLHPPWKSVQLTQRLASKAVSSCSFREHLWNQSESVCHTSTAKERRRRKAPLFPPPLLSDDKHVIVRNLPQPVHSDVSRPSPLLPRRARHGRQGRPVRILKLTHHLGP